jgi:hypothetical protein
MQFQVPQFIEVEDKIFGPFTLKEFIYLAGGIGMSVVLFLYVPYKIISVPLVLVIMTFSLALSFYRVNGKPFVNVLQSAIYYFFGSKLYIWRKTDKQPENKNVIMQDLKSKLVIPKLSGSKLKDLSWSLDINETLGTPRKDVKK